MFSTCGSPKMLMDKVTSERFLFQYIIRNHAGIINGLYITWTERKKKSFNLVSLIKSASGLNDTLWSMSVYW